MNDTGALRMTSADLPHPENRSRAPLVLVSSLTLLAGAIGMVASFLFLSSHNHLDVISGAVGFLSGVILVAAGVVSLALQSRSPATSHAAANAAGCFVAFLPPIVVVLAWPTLHFGLPTLFDRSPFIGELLADIMMLFLSIGGIGWAWSQS